MKASALIARPRDRRSAFSLIEMVGVLAIMAILASVIAPNALKSLDRAAIRTEGTNLATLGDRLKIFLRDNSRLPVVAIPNASPNWTTELADYADLSPADLLTNKRNNNRIYIVDPSAQRALLLSSMRTGLALPTAATINTLAEFDDIWNTADGSIPTNVSWNGWNAWSATDNAGDYLVIERVNFASVYATDLQSFTVTLNNTSGSPGPGTTGSYRIIAASGAVGATVNVAPGATAVLSSLRPRDRVDLYSAAGGVGLVYSFVLSGTGKTFDFNGTQWLPQ